MKNMLKILAIVLLALSLCPAVTQAQFGNGQMQMNRLERELEITDDVIRKAQEEIGPDGNALAVAALAGAAQRQEWARGQYQELRHQFNQLRYQAALSETLKAREKAASALANVRRLEQYDGIVVRDLERARDLLDKARELLAVSDHPGLRATIQSADNNLKQAWEFYRSGNLRPAYKLAGQAEKAARKILETANAALHKQGVYERRHQRVGEYLDQIRLMLGGCTSEEAHGFLNRAETAYRLAEESDEQDRPGMALRQLQVARDLAAKAENRCQGGESLESFYNRLMAELERLEDLASEHISGPDTETIRSMLDQAREQLDTARTLLNDQQFETAAISLKAAQLALRQARRLLEKTP